MFLFDCISFFLPDQVRLRYKDVYCSISALPKCHKEEFGDFPLRMRSWIKNVYLQLYDEPAEGISETFKTPVSINKQQVIYLILSSFCVRILQAICSNSSYFESKQHDQIVYVFLYFSCNTFSRLFFIFKLLVVDKILFCSTLFYCLYHIYFIKKNL